MSPRLHSYRERRPHDFGFVLPLAHGKQEWIFTPTNLPDQIPGIDRLSDGLCMHSGNLVVMDVAIDRSDVAVDLQIGPRHAATICGPWARGQIVDYSLILKDMLDNRREDEAQSLLKELQQLNKGLMIPVVVPVRMMFQAVARLLPNAPEGFATIHFRTLLTVDVQ